MKKLSVIILALVVAFALSTPASAQVDFFIDAQMPQADSATFSVSQVFVGPPLDFQPTNTFNLDFGMLSLVQGTDDDGNFFQFFAPVPAFYWAIDVGSNGAGQPDLTFIYNDTANPNGALNDGSGLGGHATVNYAEIVTNPDATQTTNDITTVALGNVAGTPIDETQFANGFLRISVGIATTSTVSGAVPFGTGDADGVYSGTYEITATFD